jgi:hypothetical protein
MRFLCALILADVGGGGERTDRDRRFEARVLSAASAGVKARAAATLWRGEGRYGKRAGAQNGPKPKCRRWVTS